MSSRFDNCMHYMHLHAMGACCPFPRSLKKLIRARSLTSRSLGCPVGGWRVGMLDIYSQFTYIYMAGQRRQQQLALRFACWSALCKHAPSCTTVQARSA